MLRSYCKHFVMFSVLLLEMKYDSWLVPCITMMFESNLF